MDISEGLAQLTDLYLETRLAPVARTIRLSAVHSDIQVHIEIREVMVNGKRKRRSRGNELIKEKGKRGRHEMVENGRRKRGEQRSEKGEGRRKKKRRKGGEERRMYKLLKKSDE